MTAISAETRIDAPITTVWAALTDFATYPEWNPFIRKFDGDLKLGAPITTVIQPDGSRAWTYHQTIVDFEAGRSFGWLGHTIFKGIFDGHHLFELRPEGNATILRQSETFEGVLLPLLKGTLAAGQRGMEKMNAQVKRRAEAGVRTA